MSVAAGQLNTVAVKGRSLDQGDGAHLLAWSRCIRGIASLFAWLPQLVAVQRLVLQTWRDTGAKAHASMEVM